MGIRDIARTWNPSPPGGVQTVMVQEFGNFTSQIIWKHAKHLGYRVSLPDFSQVDWELEDADFLFDRLNAHVKWAPSKVQVCASRKFWYIDIGGGKKNEL